MWDGVPEAMHTFAQDDFIKVRGLINKYNHRFQLTLHKLRKCEESEVDFAEYLPAAKTLLHACIGGLLDHVGALMNSCDLILRNYPHLNRDLVLTGVFLHD